jgi:transcriptional regulator
MLYIPPTFRITDLPTLHAFIERYSFATLITAGDEPTVTHLPLLLDKSRGPLGSLLGHVARANPHWQLDHTALTTLALFHGPHAYISPSWYRSGLPAVPTWNYATVHAVGKIKRIESEPATTALLNRTVAFYEADKPIPWQNQMPAEVTEKLTAAIVAFELPIDRLDGKFKLGQNRKPEDRTGAIESLEATNDPESRALATFARQHFNL